MITRLRFVLASLIIIVCSLLFLTIHFVRPQPSSGTVMGMVRAKRAMSWFLKLLGVEVETRHADRVPQEGGVIFMWNQASHLEHLILPVVLPRPYYSFYNNEVAHFPLYGRLLRTTGHIHLDRRDKASWRESLDVATERLKVGEAFVISPEGTRSRDGRLLPFKPGAFILAKQAQCAVVCVTLSGVSTIMPRGSWFARPGKVRVEFSKPIFAKLEEDEAVLQNKVRQLLSPLVKGRNV
jgi:1-acyl-sn-glycerol-3-phosphate acyltransferase